jgi:hypothetical protein
MALREPNNPFPTTFEKKATSKKQPALLLPLQTFKTLTSSRKDLAKSLFPTIASSTVSANQSKHWIPKEINPPNPFLFSSKQRTDLPVFAKKEKDLASTENRRSI